MATFSTSPAPIFPVNLEQEWKTIITTMDGQNEQRKKKAGWPKYNARLQFDVLSKAEETILWDFYQARSGAWEEFWFFSPETKDWPKQYVGTGDASETTFNLPGKSTSSQSIYIDDVLQSSGYSILTGGGSGGADRVQFTAAPTAGQVISASFAGYLRCRVRFEQDKMSRELFSVALYRTGLKLKGLAPNA